MKTELTPLPGLVVIEPDVFGDARGCFFETWSQSRYSEVGVAEMFVQDNVSKSSQGILRGLHLQNPWGQGKLVQVLDGSVYDVAVDVRVGSPTFGQWFGIVLSAEDCRQMYIPPGFAHGFCVTSERAVFMYKCTELYHREAELGIAWDDPDLAIPWPVTSPCLSAKDSAFPRLCEIAKDRLSTFTTASPPLRIAS